MTPNPARGRYTERRYEVYESTIAMGTCRDCGSFVYDFNRHDEFHNSLAVHAHPAPSTQDANDICETCGEFRSSEWHTFLNLDHKFKETAPPTEETCAICQLPRTAQQHIPGTSDTYIDHAFDAVLRCGDEVEINDEGATRVCVMTRGHRGKHTDWSGTWTNAEESPNVMSHEYFLRWLEVKANKHSYGGSWRGCITNLIEQFREEWMP